MTYATPAGHMVGARDGASSAGRRPAPRNAIPTRVTTAVPNLSGYRLYVSMSLQTADAKNEASAWLANSAVPLANLVQRASSSEICCIKNAIPRGLSGSTKNPFTPVRTKSSRAPQFSDTITGTPSCKASITAKPNCSSVEMWTNARVVARAQQISSVCRKPSKTIKSFRPYPDTLSRKACSSSPLPNIRSSLGWAQALA